MHLVGIIIKKFITMHGHMNYKKGALSPGIERPKCEADISPQSSAEFDI